MALCYFSKITFIKTRRSANFKNKKYEISIIRFCIIDFN